MTAVYESTRGQPGLVGWFGELLVEKYNPGQGQAITMSTWRTVYNRALYVEWNNMLLNYGKKARGPHRAAVTKLFTDPNVAFAMEEEWCSYLYMNGIIDESFISDPENPNGAKAVCRFSCPFIQHRLFSGFTSDMFGQKGPLLAIEIGDWIDDVLAVSGVFEAIAGKGD